MNPTPQQIEAEIEAQRAQLAGTVDALAAKLDVRSRTSAKAAELRARATTETGKPRPDLLAIAVVAAGVLVALTLWGRRK